jgi:hypothetical protein
LCGGTGKLFKSVVDVLLVNVNESVLLCVFIFVHSDEGKIGLGGDVDVSAHLLEVDLANCGDHVVHFAHVNNEFLLDSFGVVNLEVVEELVRHRD